MLEQLRHLVIYGDFLAEIAQEGCALSYFLLWIPVYKSRRVLAWIKQNNSVSLRFFIIMIMLVSVDVLHTDPQ